MNARKRIRPSGTLSASQIEELKWTVTEDDRTIENGLPAPLPADATAAQIQAYSAALTSYQQAVIRNAQRQTPEYRATGTDTGLPTVTIDPPAGTTTRRTTGTTTDSTVGTGGGSSITATSADTTSGAVAAPAPASAPLPTWAKWSLAAATAILLGYGVYGFMRKKRR
jgi:hypothetical protein